MDEMTVHVEMGPDLAQSSETTRHTAAKRLEHNIKAYVGVSTIVRLGLPGSVERSIGKAKRILDKRPKE
jgi:phenylacetate-CoA ligase